MRQGIAQIPIIQSEFLKTSSAFNNKNFLIPSLIKYSYGGCSSVVERTVVVRKTGVRFSSPAFTKRGKTK